jgi:hypothetical protein
MSKAIARGDTKPEDRLYLQNFFFFFAFDAACVGFWKSHRMVILWESTIESDCYSSSQAISEVHSGQSSDWGLKNRSKHIIEMLRKFMRIMRTYSQNRPTNFLCFSFFIFLAAAAFFFDSSMAKSEEEWRAILSPEQFRILRQKGTE